MRLSDLIKQGPEGKDPKKKPDPKPEKPAEETPKAEEDAFRLSKVADFRTPPPAAPPPPPPPADPPPKPRRRGSMLMGPEPGASGGEDITSQAGAAQRSRMENPYRPLRQRAIEYVTGAFQ